MKLDKFQTEKFLYQGTLWQKIQAAVSCKLVPYMRVLTVIDFGKSRRINDPKIYHAVKCNPEPRRRWIAPEVYDGTGRQTVQPDIFSLG